MTPRRAPVFVIIVVVLAALVFADHNRAQPSTVDTVAAQGLMPVASHPGAVSSSFYCAGGTASGESAFDATVVVANPNAAAVTVTMTTYPAALPTDQKGTAAVAALQPQVRQVPVGARARVEVHLADIQPSPFVAALVETSDPDIAVEERVTSPLGSASSPCASSPSRTWVLPTGTTTKDARELLAVFNPFPADAVVDVTFQTNDGFRAPGDLQALPVPGGHVRIVDVSGAVPRLQQLTAFVVARAGEVVAGRLQAFDGSDPNHPAGAAVTAGAPGAAPVWFFPDGGVNDGLGETVTVVNPFDEVAQVQVEVTLDDPAKNGVVEPIPVTVQPRAYTQISMADETRVPKGVAHTIVVRSRRGPPVVAERVLSAAAPAARRGYGPMLGSPLVATRWLFADGRAVAGETAEFLVASNPSTATSVRLSVSALAQGQSLAVDGLQNVEIPPGGRIALELGLHVNRPDLPLLVDATGAAVVERGIFAAKGPGLSVALGMPLAESTSTPPRPPASTTTSISLPG